VDAIRVPGCTEYDALRRYAAGHTHLDAEDKIVEKPFLGRNIGHPVGHADPQIHHSAGPELHGRPPGYKFAGAEFKTGDGVQGTLVIPQMEGLYSHSDVCH